MKQCTPSDTVPSAQITWHAPFPSEEGMEGQICFSVFVIIQTGRLGLKITVGGSQSDCLNQGQLELLRVCMTSILIFCHKSANNIPIIFYSLLKLSKLYGIILGLAYTSWLNYEYSFICWECGKTIVSHLYFIEHKLVWHVLMERVHHHQRPS